jgi:mono/diheme cytochrome c family protein
MPTRVTVTIALLTTLPLSAGTVDFQTQIRPILARKCFACHGPDEHARQAGLRLDSREAATGGTGGIAAIIPGNANKSRVIARVTDAKRPMPPTGERLSPEEIEALKQWIEQGADYQQHWAFRKPVRPALPSVREASWPRNPIDYFVLARLEKEGLRPSPQADPYTLARRVSLDLSGLPPEPGVLAAYLANPDDEAYETLVDRLLASPHYGERWARVWLDLARYADTQGYEKDNHRTIWPYRDWVVRALNDNLPFDRFTILQLAGDLLPSPGTDELIATGFHRNTMTNTEGGTDDEEFRDAAVKDRVAVTDAQVRPHHTQGVLSALRLFQSDRRRGQTRRSTRTQARQGCLHSDPPRVGCRQTPRHPYTRARQLSQSRRGSGARHTRSVPSFSAGCSAKSPGAGPVAGSS